MDSWQWHDFADQTERVTEDEFDAWNIAANYQNGEYITRDIWAGGVTDRIPYTIGFQRIVTPGVFQAVTTGLDAQIHNAQLPDSGAWVINFDVADEDNQFAHIALSFRQKRMLLTEIACAVYDHYNVAKAGMYCWYAARQRLVELYDSALGFTADKRLQLKFIPFAARLRNLGSQRRGYAIITKYF